MLRATLAILVALTSGWPAYGQTQEESAQAHLDALQTRFRTFNEIREHAIHDPYLRWSVVFSRIDAWGEEWTVLSFGIDSRGPQATYQWHAQIQSSNSEHARTLTAEECPALLEELAALERLRLPSIDVPGVGREPNPRTALGAIMDGYDNRLWTRNAGWDRRMLFVDDVEISGNIGTPVASWGDSTLAALAPCWREAQPTGQR
jgi:hypothetical protein